MELVDPSLGNGLNWEESLVPFGLGDFGTPGSVNSVPEPDSTVLVVASLLIIGLLRLLERRQAWFELAIHWISESREQSAWNLRSRPAWVPSQRTIGPLPLRARTQGRA
jgi:hypothetical protein